MKKIVFLFLAAILCFPIAAQSYSKALESSAKKDDLNAITTLIQAYLKGDGVKANAGKAAKWGRKKIELLEKKGEAGDNQAYRSIFRMYHLGNEGVAKNSTQAKYYLEKYLSNIKDKSGLSTDEQLFIARALTHYDWRKAEEWYEDLSDNCEILAEFIKLKYADALQPNFKKLALKHKSAEEKEEFKKNLEKWFDAIEDKIITRADGSCKALTKIFDDALEYYDNNYKELRELEFSYEKLDLYRKLKLYRAINHYHDKPELFKEVEYNPVYYIPFNRLEKYIDIIGFKPDALQEFIFPISKNRKYAPPIATLLKFNSKILNRLKENKEEIMDSKEFYIYIKSIFAIIDNDVEKAKSYSSGDTNFFFAMDFLKEAQKDNPDNKMLNEVIDFYDNYYKGNFSYGDYESILSSYQKYYNKNNPIETPHINAAIAKDLYDGQYGLYNLKIFSIDDLEAIYKRAGIKWENIDKLLAWHNEKKKKIEKAYRGDYKLMKEFVMNEYKNSDLPKYIFDFVKKLVNRGDKEAMLVVMAWAFTSSGPSGKDMENNGITGSYVFSTAQKLATKEPKYNYYVAECYENGIGCKVNRETAARYYYQAYKHGW